MSWITIIWAMIASACLWLVLVSLTGFVWFYLRAGRAWLAWSFVGLRTLSLLLDFLTGQNLNYLEITAVRRIPFWANRPPSQWACRIRG